MELSKERSTPLIPPRFANIEARVLYGDLPGPFILTKCRLVGLTWNEENKEVLPPLNIYEIAVVLRLKPRQTWEHLHALRRRGEIEWTQVGDQLVIRLLCPALTKPLAQPMQSFAFPDSSMQTFASAGEGEGEKKKKKNNSSSLSFSSLSPTPSMRMQNFASDDERVRANLSTLAEFGVNEKELGARETAQLAYVTPAFIRAWGADLMNTPGVKQLGRLLLHKLSNTQAWPKSEEKRGGSRKPKNNVQTPLPESDDDESANVDEIELPIDLVDGLKAIGWTDDFAEVGEYFKRDPEHVWRCLIHARTSKKAQNKPAIFRYRLRQGGDTPSTPSPRAKRPSSRKPTPSTTDYVDDNDLF
jgi:hypothetical protein